MSSELPVIKITDNSQQSSGGDGGGSDNNSVARKNPSAMQTTRYEVLKSLSDIRTTRDLTQDGVRDILRRFTNDHGLEIVHMGPLEDMSGLNDAFNSSICSMEVRAQKSSPGENDDEVVDDEAFNFVIKSPPASKFVRMMHKFTRPFFNEVTWYMDLVDLLELANGKGCVSRTIPQCYFAHSNYYDDSSSTSTSLCCVLCRPSEVGVLVLENVKFRGGRYRMFDKAQPLDLAHVTLVMTELANFHGMWLRYKFAVEAGRLEAADGVMPVPWSVFEAKHGTQKRVPKVLYRELVKVAKRTVLRILAKEEAGADLADRCRTFFDQTAGRRLTEYMNEKRHGVHTLCHGDFWSNNILFGYDDGDDDVEKPRDLVIIDYQLINVGNPCYDLVYFLYLNTDLAFREAHLKDVLGIYYDRLATYFDASDLEYTYEEFVSDYDRFRDIGFTTACSVMPNVLSDNKVEMEGNPITAFAELRRKQEADMDDENSERGKEIRRRIYDLVKEMTRDGVI